MKKYLAVGLIVLLILIGIILYKISYNDCSRYIKEENKIGETDKTPRYINYTWISPTDNSILEEIILIEEDKYSTDSPHMEAYYSSNENMFWIANSEGLLGSKWYGPFEGRPCWRNFR